MRDKKRVWCVLERDGWDVCACDGERGREENVRCVCVSGGSSSSVRQ